jgi:hypothetical protein
LKKSSEDSAAENSASESQSTYPPFPLPAPFPTPGGYRMMVDTVIEKAGIIPNRPFVWNEYEGIDDDDLDKRNAKYWSMVKQLKVVPQIKLPKV